MRGCLGTCLAYKVSAEKLRRGTRSRYFARRLQEEIDAYVAGQEQLAKAASARYLERNKKQKLDDDGILSGETRKCDFCCAWCVRSPCANGLPVNRLGKGSSKLTVFRMSHHDDSHTV
jgi:hypothetical protein